MLPVIFNFKVEINSCFFRGFVPPFKGVRRFLCISFSSTDSPALQAPPQEGGRDRASKKSTGRRDCCPAVSVVIKIKPSRWCR